MYRENPQIYRISPRTQMDLFGQDSLTDEVILDPDVPRAEGGLCGGGDGHAGFIVFAHEGRTSCRATKLGKEHAQVDGFSCGEAKRNIFNFCS
jgi:hypothetical protein